MTIHRSLIALGANLGAAAETLQAAVAQLCAPGSGIVIAQLSRFHETAPVGGPVGQHRYVNAAAWLETRIEPAELLRMLRETEARFGRVSGPTWSSRSLDLDILSFDDLRLHTGELTIPHPRMTVRRFVLDPLLEIAPDWVHPQLGWSVTKIVRHLETAANIVALGESYSAIMLHPPARSEIEALSHGPAHWRFVEHAAEAMFEVLTLESFRVDDRWRLPRFYPTSSGLEVIAGQVAATCRGLRPELPRSI